MNIQNYLITLAIVAITILADGVIKQNTSLPPQTRRLGKTVIVIILAAYGIISIWFVITNIILKG